MKNHTDLNLERKLKPINVWSLALGSIIGWGAFVMPGTTFLPKSGPLGSAIGLAIGALIMITIAMNYGYMVQKYPVAGGEYTFTKNTFGRRNAYICGWFLGLSYLSIVPLNATALGLVSRKLLGGVLEVGYLYSVAGWDIYAGEIILASLALILFAALSIKGISVAGWMQTVMALSLVASVFILLIGAILNPQVELSNLQPAYPDGKSSWASIVAVVAIAPWAFVGFDSIPQAAEEFDFSPKKANGIMIFAVLFGGFVYIAINTITAAVMPWETFMAKGYDWPTGEAVEFIMGKAGLIFLGVALICAVLSGIIGFYMATSRLLYSMSREKALPAWFGKIDPKSKTPKNAILFIMAISLTAPWFGREVLGWIVDMSSIGAAIGYGYTCLATLKTLKTNPQDHKPMLKLFAIVGAFFSLIFVLLLLVPGMPSYLAPESRICLVIWSLLGIAFYFWSKRQNFTL
ncbi:APC family permease [Emergencia sp.]|uniref:APC family permease n=1 Tax=Emergencia sp. TaxID=1926557 RepID=UPI003AF0EFDF